jgi:hypothetical protein
MKKAQYKVLILIVAITAITAVIYIFWKFSFFYNLEKGGIWRFVFLTIFFIKKFDNHFVKTHSIEKKAFDLKTKIKIPRILLFFKLCVDLKLAFIMILFTICTQRTNFDCIFLTKKYFTSKLTLLVNFKPFSLKCISDFSNRFV